MHVEFAILISFFHREFQSRVEWKGWMFKAARGCDVIMLCISVYSVKITKVISVSFFPAREKDWTSRERTRATWRVGAASDVWTPLWSGSTRRDPGETTIPLLCDHSISLLTLTCSRDGEYPREAERCVNTFQDGNGGRSVSPGVRRSWRRNVTGRRCRIPVQNYEWVAPILYANNSRDCVP